MNDFRKSKSFYRPLIIADKTQFLFFIDHFDFMLFTGMSLPFSLKTPSFILYKSCLSLTSTMYLLLFVEFQFIFLWGVLVLLILVPPPLLLMFSFCYKFWSLLGICLILKNLFSRNVTFSKEKKTFIVCTCLLLVKILLLEGCQCHICICVSFGISLKV
jgi:hypothetical protein